jgi:hypothetical protein
VLEYEDVVKPLGTQAPHPYSPKETFTDGQLIEHKKFGVGYVLSVQQPPVKVSVLFADATRLLVCGVGLNSAPEAS